MKSTFSPANLRQVRYVNLVRPADMPSWTAYKTVGLVINVPDVFARVDFLAWLNDAEGHTATWHVTGENPDEYSDVFILVDNDYEGDGSGMPEDIWRNICDITYRFYPQPNKNHVVVRLTNLAE